MKYSPQKHEEGTPASVEFAKSMTPGEKKKKNKERERPDVPALFAGMSTVWKFQKFTHFMNFLQKFREIISENFAQDKKLSS